MKIDINKGKRIEILVDEQKNIVIFPISGLGYKIPDLQGDMYEPYWMADFPIELEYPYTEEELAEKIEYGFDQWCKHPCHIFDRSGRGKNTLEEKYYGVKGFKNAMKGKRMISICWGKLFGIRVTVLLPCKGAYSYMGLEHIKFDESANEHDFAKAVMHYVNVEVENLKHFKTYRKDLIL